MRAIGYFRSVNGEGSLQQMEAAFVEYCEYNLHQPVATFSDTGDASLQGWPSYASMLGMMRESSEKFLVVVPNASHLGNDLEAVARAVVEMEAMGAKVACDDEEFPDPLQNALEVLGVKGVSRQRSEHIKESMRGRALEGRGLGKPPYGYRNGPEGVFEGVKAEAAVVELIYRLYTKDGLGLRMIAQHLNERDIPTRRGGRWNMVTIRDILKNPAYIGTYMRFGMRLPRSHEAIIPPDVFRVAQDITQERRPRGRVATSEPFLLSGLVVCGYCGNKMMGVTRRQTWRRKDGRRARGVYRYYQCQARNNQSVCEYHTWRASVLEGTALAQLKYALQAGAARLNGHGSAEIQAIWDARVKNAERRFVQAVKKAASGEITIEALGEHLKQLDATRRSAARAETPLDVFETLEKLDSLDMADRQRFLSQHVARIVVRDESAEVML